MASPKEKLETKISKVEDLHRPEIERYVNRKRAKDLGYSTITNNLSAILKLSKHFPETPFQDLDTHDIEEFIAWVNDNYADSTAGRYRTNLKDFFKIIEGDDLPAGQDYPAKVEWVDSRSMQFPDLSTLIYPDDLRAMMEEGASSYRDRALLSWLFQGGFRASELLSLNIQNLDFDSHGVNATLNPDVEGYGLKTGVREIFLVQDAEVLVKEYLDKEHPDPDNPRAPLWISWGGTNYEGRLNNDNGLREIIYRIARDTDGISQELRDKLMPKLFRHSSATWRVREFGWGEAELRKYYGWGPTSPMPSYYVSLVERDVQDRILRDHDLMDEEREEETSTSEDLEPWTCICNHRNDPVGRFCGNCGRPRDLDTLEQVEAVEEEAEAEAVADNGPSALDELKEEMQRMRNELQDLRAENNE